MSELDEVTLRVLAIIEGGTVAEQRREAIRAHAQRARRDGNVAKMVRLVLASRCERQGGGDNVIRLRGTRDG